MTTKINLANIDSAQDYSSLATALFAKANVAADTANTAYTAASTILKVSSITYPGDDTAADTAGGQTITLTGTGFVSGASVLINGSAVSVVSVANSTTLTFTSPSANAGSYVVYVVNPDGGTAISIPGIQYSGTPTWTTAAGSIGSLYETAAFSNTVVATGDTVTYSLYSGTLPPGATFSSNGTITGTSSTLSSPTTYTFTVRATDAQNQDTNRSFSITINPDVVTWSSPTTNTSTTLTPNVAMSNVTLSASSAAGASIFYSANTLPTGVSISGNTIFGTPTVTNESTTSLVTATANTTSESSSIILNWTVSVANEPYFKYNSLLLSGDGTNNAQNNTFVDGSTNNFTITRNGNTTQGTFSPYGDNWSTHFNGGSNWLSAPANSAVNPTSTTTWTFECWVYATSLSSDPMIFSIGTNLSAIHARCSISSSGNIQYMSGPGTWGWDQQATSSNALTINTWNHLAWVRNGSTLTMYINGVQGYNASFSFGAGNSGNMYLGSYFGNAAQLFSGYISNFRYVTSVLYSGAFTPPTAALTAISGTQLLLCARNRFIDASSNAIAFTKTGSPTIQRFSPVSPSAAYSASTIGGSAYFDGTGDYLSAATNSAFDITGDFTIEAWIYFTADPTADQDGNKVATISGYSDGTTANKGWEFSVDFTNNLFAMASWGTGNLAKCSFTPQKNVWYHFSATKQSSTTSLFINGVSQTLTANTLTINAAAASSVLNCGRGSSSSGGALNYFHYLPGYISDFRIVKGTAVYTSAFTPPTAPLTPISGTSLLCNFTNAGIIDNTMINDVETIGNAKLSTAVSKFGGSSMYFDGTGDYLTIPSNPNLNFGTGDFTVECWAYFNSLTNSPMIWHKNYDNSGWFFEAATNALYFGYSSATSSQYYQLTGITLTTSTWYHLAATRVGSTLSIFLNGTKYSSTVSGAGASADNSAAFMIGSFQPNNSTYDLNGYIDDLRITKGYARYTSNFSVPTTALPKL